MSSPENLSIKDVAAALNVSPMTAHNLVTSGQLPAINVGTGTRSYWRVSRADFDDFVAMRREATARRFNKAAS